MCNTPSLFYCTPWGRDASKMMSGEVSEIINLRIVAEQVIRRMKCFKILATEYTNNILSHIDDICIVVAAHSTQS